VVEGRWGGGGAGIARGGGLSGVSLISSNHGHCIFKNGGGGRWVLFFKPEIMRRKIDRPGTVVTVLKVVIQMPREQRKRHIYVWIGLGISYLKGLCHEKIQKSKNSTFA
jgi:hypothetical protein